MSKRIIIIPVMVGIALLALGLFLLLGQSETPPSAGIAGGNPEATGLGFSYLPVTPVVSAYYDLGINSGALVTSVTPGSPADKAGVKIRDVILSFNGTQVEDTSPLLGLVMDCPAGHSVMMEIWRERNINEVELMHTER